MIFCQKNNVPCFSREYVGYNKHEEGKKRWIKDTRDASGLDGRELSYRQI